MNKLGSTLSRISAWTASRPRRTLAMMLVTVAVSVYGVRQIQVASSLAAMIGSNSPASVALVRIAEDYRTSDELLLLCELNPPPPDDGRAILERFGEAVAAALESDPTASAMIASIRFRQDPEFARFAREFVLPSAPYYMSDRGFEELQARLTPVGMRLQMQRAEALLSAPGAATAPIVEQVLQDPLRLGELLDGSALLADADLDRAALEPDAEAPLLLSRDGHTLLVRITGMQQVNDLTFAAALTDRVREVAEGLDHDGLTLELAGGYAIATTTSRGIRADLMQSMVVAVALVYLLCLVIYRRLLAPLVVGAIAGVGILAGFGAQGLGRPVITPLSASIAAMLAGLGVDYAIHLLAHYQCERANAPTSVEATRRAVTRVGGAILASGLTTMIGFGSLLSSEVAILRNFAAIGVACLLGCLAAVFFFLPASFVLMDRSSSPSQPTPRLSWVAGAIRSRARLCLAAGLVLCTLEIGVLSALGWAPKLETDLSMLHPRPNAALEATDSLPSRFEGFGEWLPVQVEGDSSSSMVESAHKIDAALSGPEGRDLGVVRTFGVHTLLPDPRRSESRRRVLAAFDPREVRAAFETAISQSVFQDGAFDAYAETIAELVRAPVPTVDLLREFPSISSRMLPHRPDATGIQRSLLVVQLSATLNDRAVRDAAIEGIREQLRPIAGATLSGVTAVAYDMERATRGDLARVVSMSGLLIVGCLLVVLRRPWFVVLALIPLCSGSLFILTAMAVAGLRLNALNSAALPLVLGITVDAGVFLVAFRAGPLASRLPDQEVHFASSVQAVIAASATTLVGFGAVCLSSTPAIRSLGLLTCVGVVGSSMGALLILVPILMLRKPWS